MFFIENKYKNVPTGVLNDEKKIIFEQIYCTKYGPIFEKYSSFGEWAQIYNTVKIVDEYTYHDKFEDNDISPGRLWNSRNDDMAAGKTLTVRKTEGAIFERLHLNPRMSADDNDKIVLYYTFNFSDRSWSKGNADSIRGIQDDHLAHVFCLSHKYILNIKQVYLRNGGYSYVAEECKQNKRLLHILKKAECVANLNRPARNETLRSCDPCRPSQVFDDAVPVEQRQVFDDVSPKASSETLRSCDPCRPSQVCDDLKHVSTKWYLQLRLLYFFLIQIEHTDWLLTRQIRIAKNFDVKLSLFEYIKDSPYFDERRLVFNTIGELFSFVCSVGGIDQKELEEMIWACAIDQESAEGLSRSAQNSVGEMPAGEIPTGSSPSCSRRDRTDSTCHVYTDIRWLATFLCEVASKPSFSKQTLQQQQNADECTPAVRSPSFGVFSKKIGQDLGGRFLENDTSDVDYNMQVVKYCEALNGLLNREEYTNDYNKIKRTIHKIKREYMDSKLDKCINLNIKEACLLESYNEGESKIVERLVAKKRDDRTGSFSEFDVNDLFYLFLPDFYFTTALHDLLDAFPSVSAANVDLFEKIVANIDPDMFNRMIENSELMDRMAQMFLLIHDNKHCFFLDYKCHEDKQDLYKYECLVGNHCYINIYQNIDLETDTIFISGPSSSKPTKISRALLDKLHNHLKVVFKTVVDKLKRDHFF